MSHIFNKTLPLEDIRQLSIIDVYNFYIGGTLYDRGHHKWARCSWHGNDSSPSLKLYTNQQKWWCYGCAAGGTAIDLVMRVYECTFIMAAQKLSVDFHIQVPDEYKSRKKILQLRNQQHTVQMFEQDFNFVYRILCRLSLFLYHATRNIKMCVRYPSIFMWQLKIDQILDNMLSADESERIGGWRKAKKVFPWISVY